jgi:riboflavin synthase
MFTGIIEERGTVRGLAVQQDSARIKVAASVVLTDCQVGDSIAVNGVCLTASSFSEDTFTADVMPETLRKTTLNRLKPGDFVNLERALALGDRLGGHMLSGHVDGIGIITEKQREGNAVVFRISAATNILRLLVPKGSIAVDGISLTVATVAQDSFTLAVIPHTAAVTTLDKKQVGDTINLENDMLGKYVERLLGAYQEAQPKELSMDFLKANGFIQ